MHHHPSPAGRIGAAELWPAPHAPRLISRPAVDRVRPNLAGIGRMAGWLTERVAGAA
ncbi:MAG: hypothetical protein LBT54_04335 [Bifidobacteriaceae bacterium]|jgi:hypothetical protein|nr:hypothetical protein [Bifidobacteriaceae bacterium]